MLSLLIIGLLLAGCMTYEKQSGITGLTASRVKGRVVLLARKILLAALCATLVWAVVYGLEFRAFLMICDTKTLSASAGNLVLLQRMPPFCKIGTALILLYGFRLLTLFSAAMLSLLVSSCGKRMEAAYVSVCGVMLLPSLLYSYMGLAPMKYLSLSVPISAMPLLQSENAIANVCIVTVCLFILIGISAFALCKKLRIKR